MGAERHVRVLVVEDHPVVAEGLRLALGAEPGFGIVGAVPTVAAAREAVDQLRPDVVLMDYRLPDGDGISAAAELRRRRPATQVVMLTAEGTDEVVERALAAGCAACLDKSAPLASVIAALRGAVGLGDGGGGRGDGLSERQIEILQLLADGRSTDDIGEMLYLSPHTVRNHIRHATARLDTHSRLEAVTKAAALGLVTLGRDR